VLNDGGEDWVAPLFARYDGTFAFFDFLDGMTPDHRLGAEVAATFTGDFLTAADINHVMGKVFTALAQNRIPQRTAATLAYLGQVMLLSLPMAKKETKFVYSYEAWIDFINNGIRLSNSTLPSPAIPPDATVPE
jgi:hypothetical protein